MDQQMQVGDDSAVGNNTTDINNQSSAPAPKISKYRQHRRILLIIATIFVVVIISYLSYSPFNPTVNVFYPSGLYKNISRVPSSLNAVKDSVMVYSGTAILSSATMTYRDPFTVSFSNYGGNSMLNVNVTGPESGIVAAILGMQSSNSTVYNVDGAQYACSFGESPFTFANGSEGRICMNNSPLYLFAAKDRLPLQQVVQIIGMYNASPGPYANQILHGSFTVSKLKYASATVGDQKCNEMTGYFSTRMNKTNQIVNLFNLPGVNSGSYVNGYNMLELNGSFSVCVSAAGIPLSFSVTINRIASDTLAWLPVSDNPPKFVQKIANSTPINVSLNMSVHLDTEQPASAPITMQLPNSTCGYEGASFFQLFPCTNPALYTNGTFSFIAENITGLLLPGPTVYDRVMCSENPHYHGIFNYSPSGYQNFYKLSDIFNGSTGILSLPCYNYNGSRITNITKGQSIILYIYQEQTLHNSSFSVSKNGSSIFSNNSLIFPAAVVNLRAGEVPAIYAQVEQKARQEKAASTANYSYWPHYTGTASGTVSQTGDFSGAYSLGVSGISGNTISINGAKGSFVLFAPSGHDLSAPGWWQTTNSYLAYYLENGTVTFTNFNYSRFSISILSTTVAYPHFSIVANGQPQTITKVLSGVPGFGNVTSIELTDGQIFDSTDCTTLSNSNVGDSAVKLGQYSPSCLKPQYTLNATAID